MPQQPSASGVVSLRHLAIGAGCDTSIKIERCVHIQRAEILPAKKSTFSTAEEKLLIVVVLVRDVKSVDLQSIGFRMLRYLSS